MEERNVSREEIAQTMGFKYNSMRGFYGMSEFSPLLLNKRIARLEKYGVNLDYFSDPDQKQMFPEPQKPTEQEAILSEIYDQVHKNSIEQQTLIENNQKLVNVIESMQEALAQRDEVIQQLIQ